MPDISIRMWSHLKRHRLFLALTGFIFIAGLLSLATVYQGMHRKLTAHFERLHEQKSFSQLQVFHQGLIFHFDRILKEYIGATDRMAKDATLQAAFRKRDQKDVTRILTGQLKEHEYLTGITLLDAEGTLFARSSDFPGGEKYVGTSIAAFEHYQKTIREKRGVVVNVLQALSGRNSLVFTQPVFDATGAIEYIISASVTLESFDHYLTPQIALAEFDALLVDAAGRVLYATDAEPAETISLTHDRVIETLRTTQQKKIEDQEVNYKQEKALVIGEKIPLQTGQFVIAASFYPVAQSATEKENLTYQINVLFTELVVQTVIIFVVLILLLIWLIQRHEKLVHSQ